MRMLKLVLATSLFAATALAGADLTTTQRAVLDAWLSSNPTYRVATDEDCRCSGDLAEMRQGSGHSPNYEPYKAIGDFNGDGSTDFAVVVVERAKRQDNFAIVIFNGPFPANGRSKPAFMRTGLDLVGAGLFVHPSRGKRRATLAVGDFFKDDNAIEPHGSTYLYDPVPYVELNAPTRLVDLLVRARLAPSEAEAGNLIRQGQVMFRDAVVKDDGLVVDGDGLIQLGRGPGAKGVMIHKK